MSELPNLEASSNTPPDTSSKRLSMSASAALLQRLIPADTLHQRTAQLSAPLPQVGQSDVCSVMVFRLGAEWFAIAAGLCRQVISPLVAHTLPHRSNRTLLGVVNVRGQMLLKVSLLEILGLSAMAQGEADRREADRNAAAKTPLDKKSPAAKIYPRMVVIEKSLPAGGVDVWVFDVDELDGMHSIEFDALEPPAAGVQTSSSACTQCVFLWKSRRVSLLDETRLFDALRSCAL